MSELSKFKTSTQFISYYSDKIQNEFDNFNLEINKLGFLGYILHILGETQFDAKLYYDFLFNEGFVGSAIQDYNLYHHASNYGFIPNFANASKAYGIVSIDFTFFPIRPNNVIKREVILRNMSFVINDEASGSNYKFTTDNVYKFVEEKDKYYGVIENLTTAKRKLIPSTDNVVILDLEDFYQYELSEVIYQIQNYDFGSFYNYNLNLPTNEFLYKLNCFVRRYDKQYINDEWDKFDLKTSKYLSNNYEESLFLKILGPSTYRIEAGSGIRGAYIPYAQVKLQEYITKGISANLNSSSNLKFNTTTEVSTREITDTNEIKNVYYNVRDLININFYSSEEGTNPATADNLRINILKWIQSRDNLINYKDYYNMANTKYLKDFKYVFKKTHVIDNNFYLHRVFRDRYYNPIRSYNHTVKDMGVWSPEYNDYKYPEVDNINISAVYDEDNYNLEPGEYRYVIYATNFFSNSSPDHIPDYTSITLDNASNGVSLSWDAVPGADFYRVYKYGLNENNENVFYYINVHETNVIDTGLNFIYITKDIIPPTIAYYPTFINNNIEYISPFVYIFNPTLNWYDSFILYPNKIINLKSTNSYYTNDDLPVFFFNIKYDYANKKTYIDLKSTQNISQNFKFLIDIQELNLYQVEVNLLDDHTFRYIHDGDQERFGLIFDSFSIKISVYIDDQLLMDGFTDIIYQMYNTTDNLKLIAYIDASNQRHFINIPVIEKSIFIDEPEYYLDKVYDYLLKNDIPNNRMVSDELQFRFLNTAYIPKEYNRHIFLQKDYDDFDIVFPLKLFIKIYVDKELVTINAINLEDDKESLYTEIANALYSWYTGERTSYYNTHFIDLVHDHSRRLPVNFVKTVEVKLTDYVDNELFSGLDMYNDDNTILDNIQNDDRFDITTRKNMLMNFDPPYIYFDLDNIDIRYILL
jgi:hypothetical protein